MSSTRVPRSECPGCHSKLDAAARHGESIRPKPGDLSVCIYCGMICQFTGDLQLMPADEDNITAEAIEASQFIRACLYRLVDPNETIH